MTDNPDWLKSIDFSQFDYAKQYGISPEQYQDLMKPASIDFAKPIFQARRRIDEQMDDIAESIAEGRREFIEQQAQANAEAYARVLKRSPIVFDVVIGALAALCGNPLINSDTLEDPMNDFVRDILGQGSEVRDQTRQGISGSSQSAKEGRAGEVDIQIRHNGKPICIYEGLKLSSVDRAAIHSHIAKATINYNPQGVKDVFVVAYAVNQQKHFGEFWQRYMEKVREYNADDVDYAITWDDEETDTGMSAIRVLHGVYKMDGVDHNVYATAVKIQQ